LGIACNFLTFLYRRRRNGLAIEVSRLQRRLSRFGLAAFRVFLAALDALAHPFTHVWLVTYPRAYGQLKTIAGYGLFEQISTSKVILMDFSETLERLFFK